MGLPNMSDRSNGRGFAACVLFCVMAVLPLGLASAQDYEAVESRLVEAVRAGELTADQAGDMMAALARARFVKRIEATQKREPVRDTGREKPSWDAIERRIEGAVASGQLTREQANAKYKTLKKEMPQEGGYPGEDARVTEYRAIEADIVDYVRAGKMSP